MAIVRHGSKSFYPESIRTMGSRYCFTCSDPIEGFGIKWEGTPHIYLHRNCALRMVTGMMRDIHEITYLENP